VCNHSGASGGDALDIMAPPIKTTNHIVWKVLETLAKNYTVLDSMQKYVGLAEITPITMTVTPANGDPIPVHSTTGNPLATAGHTWVQKKQNDSLISPLLPAPLLCGTQSAVEQAVTKTQIQCSNGHYCNDDHHDPMWPSLPSSQTTTLSPTAPINPTPPLTVQPVDLNARK